MAHAPHNDDPATAPWAQLRVEGPDALHFLNGQFTNRLDDLPAGELRLAGYCSPKGRLLTVFWAYTLDNVIHLAAPAAGLDAVVARLRMFVLRSDVAITQLAAPLYGSAAADAPHRLMTAIDPDRTPIGLAPEQPDNDAAFRSACIQAGVPVIVDALREQLVPQMIGLDKIGGIDFKKGCYPGQEVIARLHYRGKVPRQLFRATVQRPAEPGQDLMREAQSVGVIIDAVDDQALAVAVPNAAGTVLTLRGGSARVELASQPLHG